MKKLPKIKIPGFRFASLHCGIKDDAQKKDLALIYSEEPQTLVDGVFTLNKVFAAPVALCRENLKLGRGRLIVINSGIANACTGKQGMKIAQATQKKAAELFQLHPKEVYVSSTGKIGDQLPLPKLLKGIENAQPQLSSDNFLDVAKGIMTTDQYPKYATVKGKLGSKIYHIAVVAKGAGMLCPNMATMLAYVVTDLKFEKAALKKIFRNAVDQTLNRVTVDGDTSTNDTVLILANGLAGNKPFKANSPAAKQIEKQMTELLEKMARMIALDGEGATKCCDVFVSGAKSEADAKKVAYAIGNSPLVKTALFGCDPNWGRIVAAVGYSGAKVNQDKIKVKIGSTKVFDNGQGMKFKPSTVATYMKKKHIQISVDLGLGKGGFHVYMSDLTYDYVHLNAEYHT